MLVYFLVIISVAVLSSNTISRAQNGYRGITEVGHFNILKINIIAIIFGLVAGLRWKVGTDYWQYSLNYYTYKEMAWHEFSILDEPGIKIISKISSVIYDDYASMFLIASLVTIFLIIKTISKNTSMLTFSLLLFIFTGAWHGTFNGVRQYIAAAIIFWGHKYIIQKKLLHYLIIVLIATTFHISAIICILFYFIPTRKIKRKHIIIMMIAVIIFITSYDMVLNFAGFLKNETIHLDSYVLKEVRLPRILTKVAPIFFYLFFTKKNNLSSKEYYYINIMFVNAALVLATSNSAYLSRVWIYTDLFSVLFFPVLLNLKDKRFKKVFALLIVILYFIYWFYEVTNTPNLYNFHWVFERSFL